MKELAHLLEAHPSSPIAEDLACALDYFWADTEADDGIVVRPFYPFLPDPLRPVLRELMAPPFGSADCPYLIDYDNVLEILFFFPSWHRSYHIF